MSSKPIFPLIYFLKGKRSEYSNRWAALDLTYAQRGSTTVRHWTVFHMFLVRLARGFWLHLEPKLEEREKIDYGRPGSH